MNPLSLAQKKYDKRAAKIVAKKVERLRKKIRKKQENYD